jgi:hypothetical protein
VVRTTEIRSPSTVAGGGLAVQGLFGRHDPGGRRARTDRTAADSRPGRHGPSAFQPTCDGIRWQVDVTDGDPLSWVPGRPMNQEPRLARQPGAETRQAGCRPAAGSYFRKLLPEATSGSYFRPGSSFCTSSRRPWAGRTRRRLGARPSLRCRSDSGHATRPSAGADSGNPRGRRRRQRRKWVRYAGSRPGRARARGVANTPRRQASRRRPWWGCGAEDAGPPLRPQGCFASLRDGPAGRP